VRARVVNASPIILFSRIGRLDLIERLAPATLVPNAVIEEVRAGQEKDRTAVVGLQCALGPIHGYDSSACRQESSDTFVDQAKHCVVRRGLARSDAPVAALQKA